MAKLLLTIAQSSNVITPIDEHLENALAEGVMAVTQEIVPPMEKYATLETTQKTGVKNTFRQIVAALIKTLNITGQFAPGAFTSGLTTTVGFKKQDGTNGVLTFTNGVLTNVS